MLAKYAPGEWNEVELMIDVKENSFVVSVNGSPSESIIFNSRHVDKLDRITFRTGKFRGISINPVDPGDDLPLDQEAVFFLDELKIESKN